MNFFNKIEKIKYPSISNVVSVLEYIFFVDEIDNEKYVLLKFKNEMTQELSAIKFELVELDERGNAIEKSILAYDSFSAPKMSDFVPNCKLKVNPLCEQITVKVLFAKFERVYYENGEFKTIPYKIEEFKNEFPNQEVVVEDKEEPKKGKRKNKLQIKNITRVNIPKSPLAFKIIFTILLMALIVASSIYFSNRSTKMSVNGVVYECIDDKNVSVDDFIGNSSSVVIPKKVDAYNVIFIDSNAFKDSNIKSLEILAPNLTIKERAFYNCKNLDTIVDNGNINVVEDEAFMNCKRLTAVDFANASFIGGNAFKDCSITNANVPNAYLSEGAFIGNMMTSLSFSTTDTGYLNKIADPAYLRDVSLNMSYIPRSFLAGFNLVSNIEIANPDCDYEYGVFADLSINNYYIDDYIEVWNGKLISFNNGTLSISSEIEDLEALNSFLERKAEAVNKIIVSRSDLSISNEFLRQFPNLVSLELGDNVLIDSDAFTNTSITELITNTNYDLDYYTTLGNIEKMIIKNGIVSQKFFPNGVKIKELVIEESAYLYSQALSNVTYLTKLSITQEYFFTLSYYGVVKNVYEVNANGKSIANNFASGYDLVKLNVSATYVGNMLASDCPYLTTLVVDANNIELPLINENCIKLENVTLPFLGINAQTSATYEEINQSYIATRTLTITGGTRINSFSSTVLNIEELRFKGEINNAYGVAIFENIYSLNVLELNGILKDVNDLSSLFGHSVVIKTLIIKSAFAQSYFSMMSITNLVILQNESSFAMPLNIVNVYFCNIPPDTEFLVNQENVSLFFGEENIDLDINAIFNLSLEQFLLHYAGINS